MEANTASRTALAVALVRARHTRADPLRIIDDPWGERLLSLPARMPVYQMARIHNAGLPSEPDAATLQGALDAYLRANPAYPNVIMRARYTEDALHRALAAGTRQYVLLGAGLDSYGLRRPAEAAELTVIEIDHPATQSFKRQCMHAQGVDVPPLLHFIPADLATQELSAVLQSSPLRRSEPAFFSWLGVTMYLTRQANLATLRAIASWAAPGSELVFSYFDQIAFDQRTAISEAGKALRTEVAAVGEPFVSGFDPATLEDELRPLGYRLLADTSDTGLAQRYDPGNANGFVTTERSRIAHVRVERAPAP